MPPARWIVFHVALLVLLAAELTFSRLGLAVLAPEARVRRQHRNAVAATVMWIAAALAFAGWVFHAMGSPSAIQFLAGYTIEESLSIDNLFVFLLLFRVFAIPPAYQPRALFWGVLGAILLRGAFIAAGVQLLARFEWVSYIFALILLAAAIRLVVPGEHGDSVGIATQPPRWTRWISRIHPVSPRHDLFFTREEGHFRITMLFLVLIAIETADIVFALDSIPAVLSITRQPFLAYTSNILAVMGLRSLFFLLAAMLRRLRHLHFGLAAILAFASARMLAARWIEVGPIASLAVILGILAVTIAISLIRRGPLTELSSSQRGVCATLTATMTSPAFLKAVRLTHHYLGIFIAPAVLFFAFTGFLQMFSLHETTRGSSYVPPAIIVKMAGIHKKAAIPQPRPPAPPKADAPKPDKPAAPPAPAAKPNYHWPLKLFFGLVAIGLIVSTITGLFMAWKYTRNKPLAAGVLLAGILIPLLCLAF